MRTKVLSVLLAVLVLAAAILPVSAQEGEMPPHGYYEASLVATCILTFDSEKDATEARFDPRVGDFYAMPTTGGQVTLVMGAYIDFPLRNWLIDLPELPPDYVPPEMPGNIYPGMIPYHAVLAYLREMGMDIRLPFLTDVSVNIVDRENANNVLYAFEGDMLEFVAQPDIEVLFTGPWSCLVRKTIQVPAGATWWQGRMEVGTPNFDYESPNGTVYTAANYDDTILIQGGLKNWMATHNGTW